MTDTQALRDCIKKSGYKLSYLAIELGLSRTGLQNKIENRTDFRGGEIKKLSTLLNMSVEERDYIFLR